VALFVYATAACFAPFAAGGNYVETRIDSGGRDVRFWMRKPVDPVAAQNAAASISTRAHYYETEYGAPANGARSIRLLECVIPAQNFGCGALPETILVQQAWVARGMAERKFYEDVNFELAYTWFGGIAHVAFDQYPLPMDALAPYAGWEAQAVEDGGDARAERIRNLISEFDRSVATCKKKVVLPRPANADDCAYSAAWTKVAFSFLRSKTKSAARHFTRCSNPCSRTVVEETSPWKISSLRSTLKPTSRIARLFANGSSIRAFPKSFARVMLWPSRRL